MFHQLSILSDVIRREHALAASPARLERRRLAATVEALRCCTSSLAARARAIFDRRPTTCCAAS